MPVVGTDLKLYQASEASSSGGAISGTEIVSGVTNNLFPTVTSAEAAAGGSRTRKAFMTNTHATDTLPAFSFWIATPATSTTDELAIGFDDPDDDDPAQINMSDFGADSVLALVSSGSDARQATVVGVNDSGDPASETVDLNGTTEVLTSTTWSIVYGVHLDATSGSRTVTVKQGSGGTTRGTIGPNKVMCSNWISASSKGAGLLLEALDAGDSVGIYVRMTWAAATGDVDPNALVLAAEPI